MKDMPDMFPAIAGEDDSRISEVAGIISGISHISGPGFATLRPRRVVCAILLVHHEPKERDGADRIGGLT